MATYIYETIPENDDIEPTRFEIQQSMNDEPLKHHPETGELVRRVISGGFGFTGSRKGGDDDCCRGRACDCE